MTLAMRRKPDLALKRKWFIEWWALDAAPLGYVERQLVGY
jgi:hypothetical protein